LKKITLPLFFFIAATLLFFSFQSSDGVSSAAELRYVRIADDGIILYTIDSGYDFQPLFVLPKTYYVEYTGRSNSKYYIVKYMDLKSGLNNTDLFVLKGALNVADAAAVSSPYPSVTIRNALGGANLYAFPNPSSPAAASILSSNSALTYYGTVLDADGGIWHYAAYNGICGYINEAALVEPPSIPPHPNSAPPSSSANVNKNSSGGDPITTLILIAGIILPAAIIFLLMFRPIKRRVDISRNENRARRANQPRAYNDASSNQTRPYRDNPTDPTRTYYDPSSNQTRPYRDNPTDQPRAYYDASSNQNQPYRDQSSNSTQNQPYRAQPRDNSYNDRSANSNQSQPYNDRPTNPNQSQSYNDRSANSNQNQSYNDRSANPNQNQSYNDGENNSYSRRNGGKIREDARYDREDDSYEPIRVNRENSQSRRNPFRDNKNNQFRESPYDDENQSRRNPHYDNKNNPFRESPYDDENNRDGYSQRFPHDKY
jgi:hypothetical protein